VTTPTPEAPVRDEAQAKQRKEDVISALYAEAQEAITYLDERIDLSLAFLANTTPTEADKDAQLAVVSDLAAYSAGTLKRLIVVLGELTRRPINIP
jgi:hypothetical protein